jgi:ATP-dependent exoDNAse (exonuclease V) beta subunit
MVSQGTEIFDKSAGKSRKINYADFAVLLQANGDFAGIENALAEAEIPYVSIAGSGFLARQEVYDLENMLKWLSCPQDSHALFAVLRSPLFGFSDDILHDLKAGKNSSLWQCLSQKSQEDGQEELRSARRCLQDLQRVSGTLALPEIVRKIIFATAYDVALLCTASGKQKSRNVWKFLSLCSQHKHMSISEFLVSLKSMRELGVKNLMDAPLSAENAVKIMTIHKSKGLEFAAVALPRLGRSVHSLPDKLLFAKDFGISFDCSRDTEEEKAAFFTAANDLSRKMDEEEKKRLLYVATTRARDFLAMFITPRSKRSTNFGKWLMESLTLPEADGVIDEAIISVGSGDESCSWRISQPAVEASEPSALSGYLMKDPIAGAGEPPALPGTATGDSLAIIDLSLLEYTDPNSLSPTFTPVPWPQLLRVCPTDETPTVHATIQGNYFHLLMDKLGANMELPSEDERKALLYHHEVAIHDAAQQDFLLKQSEQLLITFKNSPLYSMLKSCKRKFNEYSYMIVRGDHEEEFRPDLIVEDASGQWHIVDYKTDQFEQKHLNKHLTQHQQQLITYVEDLEMLLGVKAKPWVYFAHYGRLESINIAAPVQLGLFAANNIR